MPEMDLELERYQRGLSDAAQIVSRESERCRASGDKSAMFALNRAWTAIYAAIYASAPKRPALRCAIHDSPLRNTSFFGCGCRYIRPARTPRRRK